MEAVIPDEYDGALKTVLVAESWVRLRHILTTSMARQ
jgi:hypothetical protein